MTHSKIIANGILSALAISVALETFLVILMSGFLFGIIGMVIAVPAYTMLKVIGKKILPDNIVIQLLTKNI